jgi:hypothetical protein
MEQTGADTSDDPAHYRVSALQVANCGAMRHEESTVRGRPAQRKSAGPSRTRPGKEFGLELPA